MKLFVEADVQPEVLAGERIAVLGYGSQGRAHAMNLRDSGFDVVIGLRPGGKTTAKAENDGFEVLPPDQAVDGAGLIAFLTPDMVQASLYEAIEPKLKENATLLFAHGFNIHYERISPREDLDVVLIAPKGPGDLVRRQYEAGRGVPCLMAVAQDVTGKAQARALAYAHGIGGTRGGVLETTFGEETETDLFGEQAVLCGGLSELIVRGFQTLVDAGYQPGATVRVDVADSQRRVAHRGEIKVIDPSIDELSTEAQLGLGRCHDHECDCIQPYLNGVQCEQPENHY